MKFFIATFLTALTASLLFAEPGSHSPVPAEKSRPIADPGLFSAPLGGPTPLTAAEVASGNWKIDENGGCDLEKGCPYINTTTGETRYLPDSEKKKLKSPGTKDTQKASSKNQKLTEIGSKEEFDKA
ncbi:MAG: hypothetical protein EB078_09345, partial [Proteobacteria bacterium]|nr:hypothetical protein [Pseudomonadota bacterium]